MHIRPFERSDSDELLDIFRKSVPEAFGENEINEYAEFLKTYSDPYFAAEQDGEIVGACGYYVTATGNEAHICWILTDPDRKELRIGSALMNHILHLIGQLPDVELIVCRTSQVAYKFFEKFDFQLQYTKPDVWAPGLDLHFMTRKKTI
ncbi:hypothetical protein GCM10028807_37710 [Spirosoma daeguense]